MIYRPDLWEITLPAVKAAREKGLQHLVSGRYTSRLSVPEYQRNKYGWSTTTAKDHVLDRKDAPPNWNYMFGEKSGPFAAISISDIPQLKYAAERVRDIALEDEQFEQRISLLARADRDSEARGKQIEFEFVRFVADIIDRAEAVSASSDEEMLEIYRLLEKARFANELSGDLVVPLVLTPLELDDALEISDDVWIEPLDESMQRARAVSAMYGGKISAYVIAAATHAVIIKNVSVSNSDWAYRVIGRVEPDLTQVERVIQCLHIASGRDTGYAQVLLLPHDWADGWVHDLPAVWNVCTLHRYPEEFDESGWNKKWPRISRDDIMSVPQLYKALHSAPANVHLAARRALRAVLRSDDEDRTLDATIGIEALLLGNSDRDELTHRMAQRAAAALADEYKPETIYRLLKKVYEHRSKIVHGRIRTKDTINLDGNTYLAQDVAGILLRMLLMSLLRAENPWTPETLDDDPRSSRNESRRQR